MESQLAALRSVARMHSRVPDEADDLLQDALLEALRAGRGDLSLAVNHRWIAGTIRNLGRMNARGAARRRLREARWVEERGDVRPPEEPPHAWLHHPVLDTLSPALRVVALLALAGHDRREVAWLLGLSDTALRRRIADLRKRLAARDLDRDGGVADALPLGLIRRALLPVVAATRAAGVHDPDGHLILVQRGAHVPGSGGNILPNAPSTPSQETPS